MAAEGGEIRLQHITLLSALCQATTSFSTGCFAAGSSDCERYCLASSQHSGAAAACSGV